MKVHKSRESAWKVGYLTACGILVYRRHASYYWKDVTCKKCLRKKQK